MKTKQFAALFTALALLLGLLAGCGAPASSAAPSVPASGEAPAESASASSTAAVSLVDMMGRDIVLEQPAQKVVALSAADCEILYALGAGGLVVGRGEYCDYPAEVLNVPPVQSGFETNVEQIIELAPDVIFMSSMNQDAAQVKQLEDAGIAVVVSEAFDIEGVYQSIGIIGQATGKTAEAAALVQEMKEGFAQIQAEVAAAPLSGSVYFEISPLEYGLWTAGTGTFMDEIATLLGLTNAFADVESWAEVSQEQVIDRNPDYIITTFTHSGTGPLPEEEIVQRTGWQDVSAVKGGQVFRAGSDELTRPGPRLVDGARQLYALVGGEGAAQAA